jgi:rod shape-determining protein MreC
LREIIIRAIFTRETQPGQKAIFFILLSIGLMVLDRQVSGFATARGWLAFSVTPLQYVVHWPVQMVDRLKAAIYRHDELVDENLRLKSEQLLLRSALQRLAAIESENNYLKALMQSARTVKQKTQIGELLAVNAEPYVRQVVIDKGSQDHVYIGQPVLDATGVMGQIIAVSPTTSRLLLINDQKSGVAVQNTRNGMRALANGDSYSGKLRLVYVPKTADIRVGDLFITSGLGDQYPAGYRVGMVSSAIKDPAKPFLEVYLQPSAHLDSSRQVLLVWHPKVQKEG